MGVRKSDIARPDPKSRIEGMIGVKMDDVVRTVDEYYAANPSKLEMPVVRVIWDTLIKPKLKAGIAGRPLQ